MGAWVRGGVSGWGGVRVDGNRSEACLKIQKKKFFLGGGGPIRGWGGGGWGSKVWGR